jgi:hypothetical protein
VKHDLKEVLKYKGRNLNPPRLKDRDRNYHENVTDRERHSSERELNCILLQSTTRETHKFMGKCSFA